MKPMRLENGEVRKSIQSGLVLAGCMALILTVMSFFAVLEHPNYGLGQVFVTVVWVILTWYAPIHVAMQMERCGVRIHRWYIVVILLYAYDCLLGGWTIALLLGFV